ncbi:MAG: adenosine kinase [Dehalococcoidia bacterium]
MPEYDVLGIGNAIVDVLVHADDAILEREGMAKGSMQLIDADVANALYERLPPGIEMSGGSAGNTMAGIASLGGRGAYFGKVATDQLGQVFAHDMRSTGIDFRSTPSTSGVTTGRCLILVTADAQRTMNTYLGASLELAPDDIDPDVVAGAQVTYLEGYLFDPPLAKEAFTKAARLAHDAGRRVALTLSDSLCVERHRTEFLELVERHVDILFANEHEIMSLYRTEHFDDALQQVRGHCGIAALTRSAKGSVIVAGDEVHVIDAEPVERVVDTTGAGDLYAAGFLYGLTHGHALATAARMGSIAAAEVISHVGARPETSLQVLVEAMLRE